MTHEALKITAHMLGPLAGQPPQLDALLEWASSVRAHGGNHTRWTVDRKFPAPEPGSIPIPLARENIGGWPVACCSSPILPEADASTVEHVTKRIAVEHSDLLAPEERRTINTQGFWTKSYRLPLDVRRVGRVVWFARGRREGLLELLGDITAIGQRVAKGYGRVLRWDVEPAGVEAWWFAEGEGGPVLMRALPLCDELPEGLTGCRRTFGACCPPMWHASRYCEIVEPL